MAISATRFEGFSRDFNIPIKDFNTIRDVGIFNTPDGGLKGLLESAEDLASQARSNLIDGLQLDKVSSLIEDAKGVGKELTESVSDVARMAKGAFDNIVDLGNASQSMINGIVDDVFGGFPKEVTNVIKSVGSVCRNNALGSGIGLGSSFALKPNCTSLAVGNASCPPGATQGLLGTIGSDIASAIGRGLSALKKAVQALGSLLSLGYSANLCNVLTSVLNLTGIGDKGVIGVAVAAVLNKEGLKGNIGAALDVAKSSVGNIAALAPLAIANTAQNMVIGAALNLDNIKHVSTSVTSAFESIDPSWNTNLLGEISTAKTGIVNATMAKLTDFQRLTSTFDIGSINAVNNSDTNAFSTAYANA